MAFLDKVLGNANEVDLSVLKEELGHIFVQDEKLEGAYKVFRDLLIFTNLRLILVDKQGISGNKLNIISIPYKSINFFSVQTAGSFDLDSELLIYVKGSSMPIVKTFKKGDLIFNVQLALVNHTTK